MPTVVPPLVHVVGALACGPNTVNVTVPFGIAPPEIVELIEPAEMALAADPVEGALTVVVVVFPFNPAGLLISKAMLPQAPPPGPEIGKDSFWLAGVTVYTPA